MSFEAEALPRGRHSLSPEEVRASQRARLTRAMLGLVARDGYSATTVPKVVAAARVSRNAFYELFSDKEDCFLQITEEKTRELMAVSTVAVGPGDWVEQVLAGMEGYLALWQADVDFTRTYFLELPAAGARAIEMRERGYAPFRRLFTWIGEQARHADPSLAPLDPLVPRVIVISITELVAEEVRAGRLDRLGELAAPLTRLVVRLLADDRTAARI